MPRTKKAHVFNLPKRKSAEPTPVTSSAAAAAKPPPLPCDFFDDESGYVIGAFLDAQRNASAQQAACEAVGNIEQSRVFAQKAAKLAAIALRVTKAFANRNAAK